MSLGASDGEEDNIRDDGLLRVIRLRGFEVGDDEDGEDGGSTWGRDRGDWVMSVVVAWDGGGGGARCDLMMDADVLFLLGQGEWWRTAFGFDLACRAVSGVGGCELGT